MAILYTEETAVDALCECEHESHATGPEHMYGTVRALWRASTTFGSFATCTRCRNEKHFARDFSCACFELPCAGCPCTHHL